MKIKLQKVSIKDRLGFFLWCVGNGFRPIKIDIRNCYIRLEDENSKFEITVPDNWVKYFGYNVLTSKQASGKRFINICDNEFDMSIKYHSQPSNLGPYTNPSESPPDTSRQDSEEHS